MQAAPRPRVTAPLTPRSRAPGLSRRDLIMRVPLAGAVAAGALAGLRLGTRTASAQTPPLNAPPLTGMLITSSVTAEELDPRALSGGLMVRLSLENQTGADTVDVRLRLRLPPGTRTQGSTGEASVFEDTITWSDLALRAGQKSETLSFRLVPAPGSDGASVFRDRSLQPEVNFLWTSGTEGRAEVGALRLNGLWGEAGARRTMLPTGLTIFTRERPDTATVTLLMAVRAGGRDEDDTVDGGSHWLEHAHFLGTPRRSGNEEIFGDIQRVGGQINAATSNEYTYYYNTVPAENFDLSLDVLSDQLLNSSFPRAAFDRERRVVFEEIRRAYDDPSGRAIRTFLNEVFQVSPLRRTVLGSIESVNVIPIETILAYRDRHYITSNMAFGAAGNLKHDEAVAKIAAAFARLPRGPRNVRPPTPEPVQTSPRRVNFGDGTRVAQIRMGWPTPGDDSDDAPVLTVLNDVLGTTGRRLQAEIRDRLGLVTAVGPAYIDFSDAGTFYISATTQPDRVEPVVEALAAQMQRVRDGEITEAEVAASKRAIAGRRALNEETNFNQAAAAISEVGGVLDSSEEYYARMRPVTAADVQRVARTWLDPANFTLVVVRA